MPAAKSRQRKPTAREQAAAHYLVGGDKPAEACRKAGYSHWVVRSRAAKIARSEVVREAMLEIKKHILPNEIGDLAEAALHQDLLNLPAGAKHAKARLGFERTGLEFAGRIGGPSELHLHAHAELPQVVQQMLLAKMRELEAARLEPAETGISIPVEDRPLLAETVQPIEQPAKELVPTAPLGIREEEAELLGKAHDSFTRKQRPFWAKK
jgi:hypothetical protein